MKLTVFVMLVWYFVRISATDIRTRQISNLAPFFIIIASPFLNYIPLAARLTGTAVVFVLLLVFNLATDGFGMGDVKLCAAFSFWLGMFPTFLAVILALSAALIVGKITKQKSLPLAPFLCGAGVAVYISEVIFYA